MPNTAPIAAPDGFVILSGDTQHGNLLLNNGYGVDSDVDLDPLLITHVNGQAISGGSITLASGATVTVQADGTFSYASNTAFAALPPNFPGFDSFTYSLYDGTDTVLGSVVIYALGGTGAITDRHMGTGYGNVMEGTSADNTLFGLDGDDTIIGGLGADTATGGTGADIFQYGALAEIGASGEEITDLGPGDRINLATLASFEGLTLSFIGDAAFSGTAGEVRTVASGGVTTVEIDSDGANGADATLTVSNGEFLLRESTTLANHLEINQDPVAVDDTAFADEDTVATIAVRSNDIDGNLDTLTILSAFTVTGQVSITAGGEIDYDPNGQFESLGIGESATDTITYTVGDGFGPTDTATVTVTIDGVNDAPVGQDDAVGTDEDSAIVISGATLVANDTDIDGNTVYVASVGPAAQGMVTDNGDGTFTYDPNGAFESLGVGQSATDTFTYTLESAGSGGTFPTAFELSSLNGSNGFVINGIDADDYSGYSVSSAGDVNGDGVDDVIIGAYLADPNGTNAAGESYVVFGSGSGFNASLDLSTLNGSNGFVLTGIDSGDYSGISVSAAGDVNGDGFDDVVIGAHVADPNGNSFAGESYVVFGSGAGFNASLDLSSLNGSNGFVLNGIDAQDYSGWSVSSAGDVNGDGIDDVIIGAGYADPNGNGEAGESYVVFGSGAGFNASLDLSTLNGSNGFVLNGIDGGDYSGYSVSSAGDVNGDGFDDVIIGAFLADPNGNESAGESYVVFGSGAGFNASLDLSTLDGSNGFVLNGIESYGYSGRSVASAGDVNGDGFDDVIIGAYNTNASRGESYVVFGSGAGFNASLDLSTLDGSNGFVIKGVDVVDYSGWSVSSAGDVNGDGVDDLIIGAWGADPNGNDSAGESYVVFGSNAGFNASLELLYDLNGSNGFVLNGVDSSDSSGRSVSAAGDVNGDGVDDLIIGAAYADPNGTSNAGESYVVFGNAGIGLTDTATVTVTVQGVNDDPTALADSFTTDEDNATTFTVLGNDTDPENDTLSVTGFDTTGTQGTVTDNGAGSFTYDPNGQFETLGVGDSATDSFTYTIDDGNGGTDTGTVTVTIDGVNDAPVAVNDTISSPMDEILVNVTTVGSQTTPEVAALSNGRVVAVWVQEGLNGADADLRARVFNADGTPATGEIIVSETGDGAVTGVPVVTTTAAGGFAIGWSQSQSGASDVYGRIYDGNGANPTAVFDVNAAQSGNHATLINDVVGLANGQIIYTYQGPGIETIVTDNPTGEGIGVRIFDANGSAASGEFQINDDDTGLQRLSAVVEYPPVNGVSVGAVYVYTSPDSDGEGIYIRTQSFASGASPDDDVNVWTGGDQTDPDIAITPNNIMVVWTSDQSGSNEIKGTILDQNSGYIGIGDIDISDPQGDPAENAKVTALADGRFVVTWGSTTNENIYARIYENNAGWSGSSPILIGSRPQGIQTTPDVTEMANGQLLFVWASNDGIGDTSGNPNIDPSGFGIKMTMLASDGSYVLAAASTNEDSSIVISGATLVANDTDIEGDTLSVASVGPAAQGTVTDNNDGTFTYDPNGAFESLGVGETGSDVFSYTVEDGNGGTDIASVTVTISGVNDAPTALADSVTADEDNATTFTVLGNDPDPESDTLSVTGFDTTGTQGSVTDNGAGSFTYDPNGQFEALDSGESATDSFTYTIDDGNGGTDVATVTVTVTGVDDIPTATDDTVSTDEDTAQTFDYQGNDTVPGGTTTTVDVTGTQGTVTDNGDGTFTYDPNGAFDNLGVGQSATDTFTYTLETGGGGVAFPAAFELSSLNGSNGFVLNGIDAYDQSGYSVSSAGDVNGDGVDDVIIGAFGGDPNGNSFAGESYVVFGSVAGFNASLDLSTLNGSNGFVLNGIDASDYSGWSVSSAGDVNGDGIDDVIIGADTADPNGNPAAGESYVVFGSGAGFNASLDLSSLNGSNGFVINGIDAIDLSGTSVSSAGDVNGDGVDDLVIGAYDADPNGNSSAGESYVVFGSGAGFNASLDLSSLNGSNGFVLNGIDGDDRSGISVSAAGDVNGDGFDDVIIGAYYADPNGTDRAGESYIVFGSGAGFSASLDLSTLDGSNGFVLNGIDAQDYSGISVSSAGDVNGDGFDDLIIGAYGGDPNGTNSAGESYVVFGSGAGFNASLDLSSLNGSNGFVINGVDGDDDSGHSVASAGDVNGDGYDDLIIGAYRADPNGNNDSGESYVVFGSGAGFNASLDLSTLNGSNGFVLNGVDAGDGSGYSVSSAGDVNGDGVDDLIIGARTADPNGNSQAGESYVVFGSAGIGLTDTATVTVTVQGVNDDPSAVADSVTTDEDTATTIAVLGNDTDPESDTLSVTSASAPNGTVVVEPDNTLTYTPDANFNGADTITYQISDGQGGTDTGSVSVTVNPINDAPQPVNDTETTTESGAITFNVLTNDSDPDSGDTLNIVSVTSTGLEGELTNNGGGSFTYDPNGQFDFLGAGEAGTEVFEYTVQDNAGATETATVTISVGGVNFDPVANDDGLPGGEVIVNTDTDGSQFEPVIRALEGGGHVVVWQTAYPDNGSTAYQIRAQIYDSAGQPSGSEFQVNSSDNGIEADQDVVALANGGFAVAWLTTDSAIDGSGFALRARIFDENGQEVAAEFTVNDRTANNQRDVQTTALSDGRFIAVWESGDAVDDPSGNGVKAKIFNADGTVDVAEFLVNETTDFNQRQPAVVELTDGRFAVAWHSGDAFHSSGRGDSIVARIYNSDGTAAGSEFSVEGTATANKAVPAIAALPNGQFVVVYADLVNSAIQLRSQIVDGNGVTVGTNDRIDDGTAPLYLDINEDFRPAVTTLTDGRFVVTWSTNSTVDGSFGAVMARILNADGTLAKATFVLNEETDSHQSNPSVSALPDGGFVATWQGTDASGQGIRALRFDAAGDPVNAQLITTDEDTPLTIDAATLLANDSDADGDALTITGIETAATQGTVTDNGDGTFTYDPTSAYAALTAGQTATDSFVYTVSDGEGGTDTATVTVTVEGNDDFLSVVGEILTVGENDPATALDVLANDLGDGLSVTAIDTTGTQGVVVNNNDGTVSYDPNGAFAGLIGGQSTTDTFAYTVTDSGGQTETATVTVTIEGANEAPTAAADSASVTENLAVSGNLLTNDSDPEAAGPLTVTAINGTQSYVGRFSTLPSQAELRVNTDGSFTYESGAAFDSLAAGETTTDTFQYTVADVDGGSSTGTATITITGTDDPLTPYTLTARTNEDQLTVITVDLDALDPDTPASITGFDASGLPGTVQQTGANTFEFDPRGAYDALNPGQSDTGSFTFEIASGGATDTMTVDLTIDGLAEPIPEVSFAQTFYTLTEGDSGVQTLSIEVKRTGPLTETLSVDYALNLLGNLTASDLSGPTSGTVTFGTSQDTVLINVGIAGDLIDENTENFTVGLSNPVRPGGGDVTITTSSTFVQVNDNDDPVRYSVQSLNPQTEGDPGDNSVVTFTITRNSTLAAGSVDYELQLGSGGASLNAADFEPGTQFSGTVAFAAGEGSQQISFNIAEDYDVEPNETAVLAISNPSFAGGSATIGQTTAGLTLRNDDTRQVSLQQLTNPEKYISEGDSGTTPVTFTVLRSGPLTETITVSYDLVAGAPEVSAGITRVDATAGDFANGLVTGGQVIFAPGQTTATITVDVVGDTEFEANDGFSLQLTGASSSNPNVNVQIGNTRESVVIRNDDGVPDVPTNGVAASVVGAQAFTTFDGVAYRAQLEGDYTLLQTQSGDPDPINVQGRFEAYPGSALAPVLTGIALELHGKTIEIGTGATPVLIDGVAPTVSEQELGAIDIDGDNIVDVIIEDEVTFLNTTQTVVEGRQITVILNDANEQLRIFRGEDFLSATVYLSEDSGGHAGAVEGLLGNGDGQLGNEFGLPGGAALPTGAAPVTGGVQEPTYEFFYGTGSFAGTGYLDSWEASGGSTLFNSAASTGNVLPIVYDESDLPADVLNRAIAVVNGYNISDPILRDLAVISYALTNDTDVIEGILQRGQVPIAESQTSANPITPSVFSVTAQTQTLTEGDVGTQPVLFEVYRTGDASTAVTVNYDVSGEVNATDFANGAPLSGTLSFAAGSRLAVVALDVQGDTLSETDEDITFRLLSVSDPAAQIGAGSATTNLLTDDFIPNGNPDSFGGFEDTTIVENVLANDSDDDGDSLTVTAFYSSSAPSSPITLGAAHVLSSGDTVTLEADGTLSYTPLENLATGAVRNQVLYYDVSDGQGGSDRVRVDVAITGIVDIVNARGDAVVTDEDNSTTISVLSNDSGSGLSVLSIDTTGLQGTAVQQGNAIVYDPNGQFEALDPGQIATETFSYVIEDNVGDTDTATVTVTVTGRSEPPVALPFSQQAFEDTPVTFDPTGNDTDPDGDPLSVFALNLTGTQGNAFIAQTGEVVYDTNGAFDYLTAGETDTDTFVYTVTDGQGETDTETVTMLITGVNDPLNVTPDTITTDEDTQSTSLNLLANDSGDAPVFTSLDTTGTVGQVIDLGNGQVRYDPNGQFESLTLGQSATDTFTYTVTDADGEVDTATVTVTIDGLNEPPVATDDAFSTDEDTTTPISLLGNDSDPENGALTISNINSGGLSGVLITLGADSFTYDPNGAFDGLAVGQSTTDSFTYTITDPDGQTDTATAVITVNGVNDAPTGVDDTRTMNEDVPATFALLSNDTDPDGDLLDFVGTPTVSSGGIVVNANKSVTLTPDANFNGTILIDYVVTDNNGGSDTAQATVTVNAVNDAPVAGDDTATTAEDTAVGFAVLGNDTDVENDSLTVTSASAQNGVVVVEANNTLTYTPDLNFNGTDTVSYVVDDGQGGSDTGTVTMTVTPVNDTPVAVGDTGVTNKNTSIDIDVLANDTDVDGDALVVDGIVDAVNGTVTTNPDGTLRYTPDNNFVGSDTFAYRPFDGTALGLFVAVDVDVFDSNIAPVAVDDTATTGVEAPVDIDVLSNDTDVDNDPLSVTSASAANGVVVVNGNNTLTYTPNADFGGDDTLSYVVDDGQGGSDTGEVIVTVTAPGGGTAGNDTINGTSGDDTIFGLAGQDRLDGLGGNDSIVAGSGNDRAEGGDDDDRIEVGAGDDTALGEGGNDTLVDGPGNDTMAGGPGFDWIDLSDRSSDTYVNLNLNRAYAGGTYTGGSNYINATETNVLSGIENIAGSEFNDLLIGKTGSAAEILGLGGNDRITTGTRNDTLTGGAGNDTMIGDAGSDFFIEGAGNDLVSGGPGFDTLDYSQATGSIFVDLQNNRGEAGGSLISNGNTYINATEVDTIVGTENVIGSEFDDLLKAKSGSAAEIFGRGGNDRIVGGTRNDKLHGDAGDDTIIGGAGNDTIYDAAGNDQISADTGSDTADFSAHTAGVSVDLDNNVALGGGTLTGSTYSGATETNGLFGVEAIVGSNFGDLLIGKTNTGAKLDGLDGNDRLVGGSLRDQLTGGDGDDTLIGNAGDDIIYDGLGNDIMAGNQDNDEINMSLHTTSVRVDLTNNTAEAGGTVSGAGIYSGGTETNTLSGFEIITGSDQADVLVGRATGQTTINGGDGNDVITGGTSSDRVSGGSGNDDVDLVGGADTFVFSNGEGSDDIANFGTDDLVVLANFNQFGSDADVVAALQTSGSDVTLAFNNGDLMTFENTSIGNFSTANFDLI